MMPSVIAAARSELRRLKSLNPATAAALLAEVERLSVIEDQSAHAQQLRAELGTHRALLERGMAGHPIQLDGAWWTMRKEPA